jgi:hypothetical protein
MYNNNNRSMELREDRNGAVYPVVQQEIGRTNGRRSDDPIQDKKTKQTSAHRNCEELEDGIDPRQPSVVDDYRPGPT